MVGTILRMQHDIPHNWDRTVHVVVVAPNTPPTLWGGTSCSTLGALEFACFSKTIQMATTTLSTNQECEVLKITKKSKTAAMPFCGNNPYTHTVLPSWPPMLQGKCNKAVCCKASIIKTEETATMPHNFDLWKFQMSATWKNRVYIIIGCWWCVLYVFCQHWFWNTLCSIKPHEEKCPTIRSGTQSCIKWKSKSLCNIKLYEKPCSQCTLECHLVWYKETPFQFCWRGQSVTPHHPPNHQPGRTGDGQGD